MEKLIENIQCIRKIKSGEMPGFDKALFVSSLTGFVERAAKRGDTIEVKKMVELIRKENEIEPFISAKNKIFKMEELAEQYREKNFDKNL